MNFVKVSLIFGGIVGLGVIGYLSDKKIKFDRGYCFAQGRYISEQEMVDIAVMRLIKELDKTSGTLSPDNQSQANLLQNHESFYSNNPHCCQHDLLSIKNMPELSKWLINDERKRQGSGVYQGDILFTKFPPNASSLHKAIYKMKACGEIYMFRTDFSTNYEYARKEMEIRIDRRLRSAQ